MTTNNHSETKQFIPNSGVGIDLALPLLDIFPHGWKDRTFDNMQFRNLTHFINYVSVLKQKTDKQCGMSYEAALEMLQRKQTDMPGQELADIQNLVRSNLHKRGLISEEVYERYCYTVDGTNVGVDVGKFAAGDSACVISPARQYVDFFFELYISISYPWSISDSDIRNRVARVLATVAELERQHIFIKITLVLPIQEVSYTGVKGARNFFASIPLFSHKDTKTVDIMSAVINDRLLRKFFFAVLEDTYGNELADGYGRPMTLKKCMNLSKEFDEIAFFNLVVEKSGATLT